MITDVIDVFQSGDTVLYIDAKAGEYGRTYYVELVGIWDGEKVEFPDKEKTVIRNINWLKNLHLE